MNIPGIIIICVCREFCCSLDLHWRGNRGDCEEFWRRQRNLHDKLRDYSTHSCSSFRALSHKCAPSSSLCGSTIHKSSYSPTVSKIQPHPPSNRNSSLQDHSRDNREARSVYSWKTLPRYVAPEMSKLFCSNLHNVHVAVKFQLKWKSHFPWKLWRSLKSQSPSRILFMSCITSTFPRTIRHPRQQRLHLTAEVWVNTAAMNTVASSRRVNITNISTVDIKTGELLLETYRFVAYCSRVISIWFHFESTTVVRQDVRAFC